MALRPNKALTTYSSCMASAHCFHLSARLIYSCSPRTRIFRKAAQDLIHFVDVFIDFQFLQDLVFFVRGIQNDYINTTDRG